VRVAVRAFHNRTAVGFNSLRRGVDIGGLDADDDPGCMGWSTAVASAIVTGPPSRAAKWAPSRNFYGIPMTL
jgi:hypothetical protein